MQSDGTFKGNVDAELVLHCSAIEYENYDKAIIVSGDGDFTCLAQFLLDKNKLLAIMPPSQTSYSSLLKKFAIETGSDLLFISRARNRLEKKVRYK